MHNRFPRALAALAFTAVLFFCLCAGYRAAGGLTILCGGSYGLRAAAPLTLNQQESARSAAAALGANLVFWEQLTDTVSTQGQAAFATAATAQLILCAGEPALALGTLCLYGRMPTALEPDTCCISAPLARALWGALDARGQVVLWQGAAYKVCGVAQGDTLWLLCQAPRDAALTAMELQGLPECDPRGAALQVAAAAGLAGNTLLVPGSSLAAAAGFFSCLPLLLAGLALAGTTLAALSRRLGQSVVRQALWFCLAVVLALALPTLLAALPPWLIPDRWSDFAFWQTLLALPEQTLQALLALPPSVRDDTLQALLLQSAAACIAALAALGASFHFMP